MNSLFAALQDYEDSQSRSSRPFVTVSYAQTLDGSITARRGDRLTISGEKATRMTHKLRAHHDGILVGIGTALADNPQLTARGVSGEQPQPVLLDSQLRIPDKAKLFVHPIKPWIFTSNQADQGRLEKLTEKGVKVVQVGLDGESRLLLEDILTFLFDFGIKRVMVEGGAAVIASFLASGLVDAVALTIAPAFVGGQKGIDRLLGEGGNLAHFPGLVDMQSSRIGEDLVVWGRYRRGE